MDFFGIGQAMRALHRVYCIGARATGRTKHLLDSLRPGDRVICLTSQEMHTLAREIQERKIEDVEVMVCPAHDPGRLHERAWRARGRLVFDHTWLEEFYGLAIASAAKEIDWLQERLSHAKSEPPARYEPQRWDIGG